MTKNITSLSSKESQFLTRLAETGNSIITIEQARTFWSPPERTADVLHRLNRKGWLHRLERGTYLLVPLEAGPKRAWTENSWLVAQHLVEPSAIAYWSALHYWGLTEQIPQVVFVQTTRRKASIEVLGVKYRFVTVLEKRFFGIARDFISGKPIQVTDREKTLLDCSARPDLSGGIFQLAQVLQHAHGQFVWDDLDRYLERWDGGTVVKRLGYLVETLGIPDQVERLTRWRELLTSGISPLEPGSGTAGPICTRWQVQVNVPLPAGLRAS